MYLFQSHIRNGFEFSMTAFFWDTFHKEHWGVPAGAAAGAAGGGGGCDVPADYRDDKKSTENLLQHTTKSFNSQPFFVPFNHIGSLHLYKSRDIQLVLVRFWVPD